MAELDLKRLTLVYPPDVEVELIEGEDVRVVDGLCLQRVSADLCSGPSSQHHDSE